nr:abscisic acid 8'-hydroxylase 2-like [Ipomoea batatas]
MAEDWLGVLLRENHQINLLSSQIADNIIGVIFAAHGHHKASPSLTLAASSTCIDNLHVLQSVTVIQETLRRASIPVVHIQGSREDVEFEGYSSPRLEGSASLREPFITLQISSLQPREVPRHPTSYMPFGMGVHSCPGSELAKLEMLILLTTLLNYLQMESDRRRRMVSQYGPFPVPKTRLTNQVQRRLKTM